MNICPYARQLCKYPDRRCPREELRSVFATDPERAVRKVWGCQWAGGRLSAASYLMYLIQEEKVKL